MPDSVIPDDVKQFIVENIDSIAQLEGLLLLRTDYKSEYNAKSIAERLYISEPEAASLLSQLYDRGFLKKSPESNAYNYQPRSSALSDMVENLAETYTHYLLAVTHLIHSKGLKTCQGLYTDCVR
jgi:DNA-binding IclR family transcriptional regulator